MKSPIIILFVFGPSLIILCAFSQNSGVSFEGAYIASVSIVVLSGSVMVKKSVSILPWSFMFDIVHPLLFLRKTRIPLCLVGFPWIVYLENNWRCRFFRDASLVSHKCVSITILMSLVRSKKV